MGRAKEEIAALCAAMVASIEHTLPESVRRLRNDALTLAARHLVFGVRTLNPDSYAMPGRHNPASYGSLGHFLLFVPCPDVSHANMTMANLLCQDGRQRLLNEGFEGAAAQEVAVELAELVNDGVFGEAGVEEDRRYTAPLARRLFSLFASYEARLGLTLTVDRLLEEIAALPMDEVVSHGAPLAYEEFWEARRERGEPAACREAAEAVIFCGESCHVALAITATQERLSFDVDRWGRIGYEPDDADRFVTALARALQEGGALFVRRFAMETLDQTAQRVQDGTAQVSHLYGARLANGGLEAFAPEDLAKMHPNAERREGSTHRHFMGRWEDLVALSHRRLGKIAIENQFKAEVIRLDARRLAEKPPK